MTAALLCVLVLVRAVVAALRRADMLTGDVDEDRRRVLSTLGSLGLASLLGPEPTEAMGTTTFARPLWRRARLHVGPVYDQQLSDASMVVMSARVFNWFLKRAAPMAREPPSGAPSWDMGLRDGGSYGT